MTLGFVQDSSSWVNDHGLTGAAAPRPVESESPKLGAVNRPRNGLWNESEVVGRCHLLDAERVLMAELAYARVSSQPRACLLSWREHASWLLPLDRSVPVCKPSTIAARLPEL